MYKKLCLLIIISISPIMLFSQQSLQSPYLQNPEKAIAFIDSSARFWFNAYDNDKGGFYHDVDKQGNPILQWGGYKNTLSQSRNAYGFTRAFMVTGDTTFLTMAENALDFMYSNAWDNTYGGWYRSLDKNGTPNTSDNKSAFDQHYALLGPAAYFEATGDTIDWNWLMAGYDHLEEKFWDNRPDYLGYYDYTNRSGSSQNNKSFNSTVDAITTHLLYLYFMTGETKYEDRLYEIADQMINRLVASMPSQTIGFVEKYDNDWNWITSETNTIMGHVLKTSWCLARLYQINDKPEYLSTAETLFLHVYDNAWDHEFGGPYKDYNRVTGEMLMWGNPDTAKAWWQMEQAITAGLMLYEITGDSLYLGAADETLDFFMRYFVDHENSEVYADRTRYGALAWNEIKGGQGKAAYHSVETGYYTYLYGNLFIHNAPVTLHYYFKPLDTERQILLTPLAIANDKLHIKAVLKDDNQYTDFNSVDRTLQLAAHDGGHFTVTYGYGGPTALATNNENLKPGDFELHENYPNPFNPKTTIRYSLNKNADVELSIYNLLGQKVADLFSGNQSTGSHRISWDASGFGSGVFIVQLKIEPGLSKSHKIMLIK